MLRAKLFFYHPTLPCHSILLGKTILPLCTPFGGIDYIYIYSFKNIFYHPSLLYQPMLLGGGGCCMPNFSFIILHCSVSHPTRTNTLPLLTPLGGIDFMDIYIYLHFFQESLLSSFIALSIHAFGRGWM